MTRAVSTSCSSRTFPREGRCAGNHGGCTNACGWTPDARTTATAFRYGKTIRCSAGPELQLRFEGGAPPKATDPHVASVLIAQAGDEFKSITLEAMHRNLGSADSPLDVKAGSAVVGKVNALHLDSEKKNLYTSIAWTDAGWSALTGGQYIAARAVYESNAKTTKGEPVGTQLQAVELKLAPTVATLKKGNPMPLFRTETPSVQSVIDQVNASPGRNAVEKANAYLLATRPSHASLPWSEQVRVADAFSRQVMSGKLPEGVVLASARPAAQSLDALVAEINGQPGRNPIEKCDALLCSRSAAHKAKPWGERVQLADAFSRQVMAGEMPVFPA